MIKPCGLVCCVAYPYALAILCPVASVALLIALCSLPRLSFRLCSLLLLCLLVVRYKRKIKRTHTRLPRDGGCANWRRPRCYEVV